MATALAITGAGWVTPDGTGTPAALLQRAATLAPGRFTSSLFASAAADAETQQQLGPHGGFGHRLAGLAVTAGRVALRQAAVSGETARNRLGCVLGTMFSGQTAMIGFGRQLKQSGSRFVTPLQFPETVGNYAASTVARLLDLQGANLTVCTGAPSGLAALVEACDLLESGAVDYVIAGGADVLADELVDGLDRLADRAASGAVPSLAGSAYAEGACMFSLEREPSARQRGAAVLGRIEPLFRSPEDHFDVIAVGLEASPDARAYCRRRLDTCIDTDAVGVFAAPDLMWGNAFAAGSAAQVAMILAAFSGSPLPIVSLEDPEDTLPTWSVVEGASRGLAVGGQNGSTALLVALTAADDA